MLCDCADHWKTRANWLAFRIFGTLSNTTSLLHFTFSTFSWQPFSCFQSPVTHICSAEPVCAAYEATSSRRALCRGEHHISDFIRSGDSHESVCQQCLRIVLVFSSLLLRESSAQYPCTRPLIALLTFDSSFRQESRRLL